MHELGRRYWLNLLAQSGDGEAVDARQQAAVAPLEVPEVLRKWPRRMAPVASRRKSEASMEAGEMRAGIGVLGNRFGGGGYLVRQWLRKFGRIGG